MKKSAKLISLKEAEEMTGRKVSTWRNDLRKGRVAFVRLGRQVRIPIEVIDQLVAKGFCPALGNVETGR